MPVVVASSELDAPVAAVWESVGAMPGVNYELMPLVRMSAPREARELRVEDAPLGVVLFRSVVSLGGVLPFDLHSLCLVEVTPRDGFVEESTTWVQRRWRHERRLREREGGCTLTDTLTFEPRLGFVSGFAAGAVERVFRHRHARLHARFGGRLIACSRRA